MSPRSCASTVAVLQAVCDHADPSWRASALGAYRFWRDMGVYTEREGEERVGGDGGYVGALCRSHACA